MERCGFMLLIQKKEKTERGRKGGRRKKGGKEPGKEEKKDGQYSYIERMEKPYLIPKNSSQFIHLMLFIIFNHIAMKLSTTEILEN